MNCNYIGEILCFLCKILIGISLLILNEDINKNEIIISSICSIISGIVFIIYFIDRRKHMSEYYELMTTNSASYYVFCNKFIK